MARTEAACAPSMSNVRLAAVMRFAYEAADAGLLSPELAAGIRRVKGAKRLGRRVGNWLTLDQARSLVQCHSNAELNLRGKRDRAIIALLLGCGLRRAECVGLWLEDLQLREEHSIIADLVGKAKHVRTIPVPIWVKTATDDWTTAAEISAGYLFRKVTDADRVWAERLSAKAIWHIVKRAAKRAGIDRLAPHDLRRSCPKFCHMAGGELEQIQFLLGHVSHPDNRAVSRL